MINFDDVQKNTKKNTIQIGHKFLNIDTEYYLLDGG